MLVVGCPGLVRVRAFPLYKQAPTERIRESGIAGTIMEDLRLAKEKMGW